MTRPPSYLTEKAYFHALIMDLAMSLTLGNAVLTQPTGCCFTTVLWEELPVWLSPLRALGAQLQLNHIEINL